MKRLILMITLLAATTLLSARPAQLTNFVDLLNALQHGEDVQLVAHYGRATLVMDGEEEEFTSDVKGGMNVDTWEYFAPMSIGNEKGLLVFGVSKLIENPLGEGYVHNYVKVRVWDDGVVNLTARYLDAATYEVEMDETFVGRLNAGRSDMSPFLFFAR